MELIKPMLCNPGKVEDIPKYTGMAAELKLDGMRALVYKLDGELRVFGRSGIEYTNHLHEDMRSDLSEVMPDNSILDGELVHLKGMKRIRDNQFDFWLPDIDFNKTMRVMGSGPVVALRKQRETPIDFVAFDILQVNNQDLMNEAYEYRRQALDELSAKLLMAPVWNLHDYKTSVEDLFEILSKEKFEGLVLKKLEGIYRPNSRTQQIKLKAEKYFDVVVMGATAGMGKYSGMIGALKFGAFNEHDKLVQIGQCSGMTDMSREWWTLYMNNSTAKVGELLHVIEIKCNDLLSTGTPRHPQYVRRRTDKLPHECRMDQFNA